MPNPRIATAIAALCEAFNRQPTPATFAAYEMGLAGMSAEQVEAACTKALQRCKFMPVPAELRELAAGDGAGFEATAEKAFHRLREAVKRFGPDTSVNFHDGAINATVRLLGGWQRVCNLPCEEFDKWFRKEFIATYCRVCRDGASDELRRYLGGTLECENAKFDGRVLKSGHEYRLGEFGTDIVSIGSPYPPALPAPEPKRMIGVAREQFGLELKRIESS